MRIRISGGARRMLKFEWFVAPMFTKPLSNYELLTLNSMLGANGNCDF